MAPWIVVALDVAVLAPLAAFLVGGRRFWPPSAPTPLTGCSSGTRHRADRPRRRRAGARRRPGLADGGAGGGFWFVLVLLLGLLLNLGVLPRVLRRNLLRAVAASS